MVAVKVVGTQQFTDLAHDLKRLGRRDLLRELSRSLRAGAKPVEDAMRARVQGMSSTGSRGGASARAARAAQLVRRRKNLTEKVKLAAHRRSGLRAAVARTVQTQVRTAGSTASVRIRSNSALMPADQRKLPRHMNKGRWRHPVFGNVEVWVTQTVSPDEWFDQPARQGGPGARDKAIDTVGDYVEKTVG
ncbi:MAG TPA: hypothetical protein VGX25_04015 [Actinophytocola sp.]|uniref:hypothetical protein n=1 Tax=Actinophytocola sp. TaxID=1872138 RepID=UPI002DDD6F72|nr:hypothetical protein [Actinophytocola sp.]HEV2778544.1 hypothetical protein [Actinophytocola sp.]